MKKILLSILIASCSILQAQIPCINGMAGDYPCNGYDLQVFIPCTDFGADNANDSWGWTDPDDGTEYALVGLDNGTAFLDISDPINPIYLGKLPTHTSSNLTRLRDVANPPETFTEDAHYGGFGGAHNIVINEETGYAYGVGADYSGGAHFVNIQDPLNPIGEGGYSGSGYTHDAQVVVYDGPDSDYTGKEIYIGSNEDKVVIVDVTDKTNPVLISAVTYTNDAYTHQGWFTEDLTYFIVGDEIDELNFGFNTRNIVFDFTDLDNPQLSFEYSGPTSATDHNGYVDGDKFYLANYKAGMRVIDISDISNENMTEIGFFDVFPSNNTAGYDGAWNVYPYFASGNILISSLKYSSPDYVPGFYLVKSSTLSVDDNFLSNFSLYPNPSTNSVKLSSTNTPISEISIYDLSGKLLLSKKYNSEININLNISNLDAGIYLLKINNKKSIKLIKN